MITREDGELQSNLTAISLCAFALADCVVQLEPEAAKYLRAVHRTALELAIPNLFGLEIGGYWLATAQINQLRKLPDCYPANEMSQVQNAVEAFLQAQTKSLTHMREIFHQMETSNFNKT